MCLFLAFARVGLQVMMSNLCIHMVYLGSSFTFRTNLLILGHHLVMVGLMYAEITIYIASYPPVFFTVMTAFLPLSLALLSTGSSLFIVSINNLISLTIKDHLGFIINIRILRPLIFGRTLIPGE